MIKMRIHIGLLLCILITACNTVYEETRVSLDDYNIEKGFTLEIIAAEPLLKAPVAMDFDDKGRMWVAQMPGYMNDMHGSDEQRPTGSIKILEDLDADGIMDHTKIFLDSLIMPRALAHVYGGLLYAEPPNLWFVEIEEKDKPGDKVLVDSLYAAEGNPEHQPNGLLLNIDNWIYNAKSNFRYRRKNGIWEKEPTTFRGQWGLSKDNFGRLYYNDNSRQLLGDHVLPNCFIRNRYFTPKASLNQILTENQRVYPLHPTTVNRGYARGVLDQDSILVNTTAACSPLVYRGEMFPYEYHQNVFVCIPEGNLIKRNVLNFTGAETLAEQAWEGKEFLASTDEGFRPVNLYNGPDGNMYIVDMHRGMIGHHAYLSPYLKDKVEINKLDTITDFGRILKISNSFAGNSSLPNFDNSNNKALVRLLENKNGWIRDKAQHRLILNGDITIVDELKALALSNKNSVAPIHALYTLEGLGVLDFNFLRNVARLNNTEVTSHALVLMEAFVAKANIDQAHLLFEELISRKDITTDLYMLTTLGTWLSKDSDDLTKQFVKLLERYKGNLIFGEAALSGLEGNEYLIEEFITNLGHKSFIEKLAVIKSNRKNDILNPIFSKKSLAEDNRTSGSKLFRTICASCHGINGEGIDGLAPPLNNSEYVTYAERLGLIILHGLEGPVHVNGNLYDLNLAMPGLIRNEAISDKDIADIVAYVTSAFSDIPIKLETTKVQELRSLVPESGTEYTEKELLEYSGSN